ncbi:MAG: GDP-mannose 4,6-dehydratase [Candidatus Omnitrophica bacterium]|nr:GDP-mannose 4,6-dehydratase [Candidatus Omnitrophota bacterium]
MSEFNRFYKGKKILITGGLGFIGSNLARRLAEFDSEIVLVDSLIPDFGGNLFNIEEIKENVTVNISDVRDESSMSYLVRGHDIIFNLAGTLSHIDSMTDPFTDLEINCRSQLTILECCRKYNPGVKIIFSGTRGQYGKAQYLPVDEKHPMCPTDVNGINNMAGEWYHILYSRIYGIRAVSLRLTNTYGPRHQMKHSKQGFLNWFLRLSMEGENINIYGDGSQKRDFNYIDDVVEAFLIAGANDKTDGEVYNIGSGIPGSVKEVADKIVKTTGSGSYKLIPYPKEKQSVEIGDYYADYSKFKKAFGWEPKVSIEEGLKRTFEFYKKYRKYYW